MPKSMLIGAVVLTASLVSAQAPPAPSDVVTPADAEADVRYFDDLLQRVHADPYTAFGGKVAYAKRMADLLAFARSSSHTRAEWRRAFAGFLADLGDGHTYMDRLAPRSSAPAAFLPVRFTVAADEIFVSDARRSHADLLGARIAAVEGRTISDLEREVRLVFPQENASGAKYLLARMLGSRAGVEDLLGGSRAAIAVRLILPSAAVRDVSLSFEPPTTTDAGGDWVQPTTTASTMRPGPVASMMLPERQAACLKIRQMLSREAFEVMAASGRTDIGPQLDIVYRGLGKPRPPVIADAIAGVPSLIEEAHALLSDMRRAGVGHLVVDLRGNNGGWSQIVPPLMFQIFGDRYLASSPQTQYATLVSPEYLSINGTTLERLNAATGRAFRLGDYRFSGGDAEPGAGGPAAREQFFARLEKQGMRRIDLLRAAEPRPLRVTVLTDGGTFSAGFDLAWELARFGARLVGVAPAQAPAGFVDGTPFELPRTKLRGSISRTSVTHGGVKSDAHVMLIDEPMTWARYRDYRFDADAPLRFATDSR